MRFFIKAVSIVACFCIAGSVEAGFGYRVLFLRCFPFVFCQRQGKGKSRSFPHFRTDGDGSAQSFDNGFADRQSQSRTLRKGIHLYKAFKDLCQFVSLDADAGVADVKFYFVSFAAVSVADAASCGEFEGISDEVRYNLEDAVLVAFNGNLLVRGFVNKLHTFGTAEFQCVVYFLAERVQAHRGDGEFYDACFNLGEVQDFVYQLQKSFVVGFHDVVVVLPLFGIGALGNDSGKAYDGVERGTYLVAHIGKESRFQLVGSLRFLFGHEQFPFHPFHFGDVPFDTQ